METVQALPQVGPPLTLGADECRVQWQTTDSLLVLDVRKVADWNASPLQIQGAHRLDPDDLPRELTWPKGKFIMLYCH